MDKFRIFIFTLCIFLFITTTAAIVETKRDLRKENVMRIDVPEKRLRKSIEAIRELENMDFPEITDGNKQSDLLGIVNTLMDLSYAIEDEIDF